MPTRTSLLVLALALALLSPHSARTETPGNDGAVETLTVTGSSIRRTTADLPFSVSVMDRDTMEAQGSLSMVDLFRNFSGNMAGIGEQTSWSNGPPHTIASTVTSINLRGLGASRTLVLINGRRQVPVPARLPGGRFVDVNTLPSIAIGRIDILKEGASAVYGSDAMAGVANILTRGDHVGFEMAASHEIFDGGGDTTVGGIWGGEVGSAHAVVALDHVYRQKLNQAERDYAVRPASDWWGWARVGNPGAFFVPPNGSNIPPTDAQAPARFIDPACADFGGHPNARGETCQFRYAPWDNLIEESRNSRFFSELNGEFGATGEYRLEALWAKAVIPAWMTTPSYIPTRMFDGIQRISPEHPGRKRFVADHPTITDAAGREIKLEDSTEDWWYYGRLIGNTGPGREFRRETRTWRLAGEVGGDLEEFGGPAWRYDLAASYSHSQSDLTNGAESAYRRFLAFRGYGGPNCGAQAMPDRTAPSGLKIDPDSIAGKAPGEGGCLWYNPFGNSARFSAQPGAPFATTANPAYDPALANDPQLMAWLTETANLHSEADLYVFDASLNGAWDEMNADYAVGYQFRRLEVEASPNDRGNLNLNPCRIPGDLGCDQKAGRTGLFVDGGHSSTPYSDHQTAHAGFGEVAAYIGERIDVQAAARYENYGENHTFDPKAALRWQLHDSLALRGSAQSTFRTPSVDDLNENVDTQYQLIQVAGAYKAVDTVGDPDLEPESAFTYSLGLALEADGFSMTADYWSHDLDDQIRTTDHNALGQIYRDALCLPGDATECVRRSDIDEAALTAVRGFIKCPDDAPGRPGAHCLPGQIERITARYVNGPRVQTSGIDLHLEGLADFDPGHLSWGFDGTYLLEYKVDAMRFGEFELTPAKRLDGHLNDTFTSDEPALPRWKASAFVAFRQGGLGLSTHLHYISSYANRAAVPFDHFRKVESHVTWDMNLQWRPAAGNLVATFSILNVADEDPPLVLGDQFYDPQTHDAKGRRFKLNLRYEFGV